MTSYLGRLFVALVNNGPSDTPPIDSLSWEPADSNMSYRGPFVINTAHYRLGDTTLDNSRLYMLTTASLVNSTILPSQDPTNWIRISIPEATQAEVTAGIITGKFVSPLELQRKLNAQPAGNVVYASEAETKALTIETKAINPRRLRDALEPFARSEGSFGRARIPHDRLQDADLWVDNGGVIELADGFEDFALVYKRRRTIGHPDQRWVPVNLNTIFDLQVGSVGMGQDIQHNYGIKFLPGAVRRADIQDILDLNNLLGLTYIRYPTGTVGNGTALVPRLTTPWTAEAMNGLDAFTKHQLKFPSPSPTDAQIMPEASHTF